VKKNPMPAATTNGADEIAFDAGGDRSVSALIESPGRPRAMLVLGHGAGAGMRHPFLGAVSKALAERGIATLRYQFPYMEAGKKSVDSPAVAHAAVRAAVAEAVRRMPSVPVFAGGKSFGGRMTSEAAGEASLPGVHGLVFLGFPLHPPGKPEAAATRGKHLKDVTVPMLFLQGTRDEFAQLDLLKPRVKRLGKTARLHLIEDANHSFKVPAASGRKDADVRAELADAIATWMGEVLAGA
jgi:predicted alpha/beta-hydrolase family hydrolase